MASRYDNLNLAIEATVNNSKKTKPYRIVEIGTHTADRAVSMISLAKKLGRTNIEYYGFDLFEDMSDHLQQSEFCRSSFPVSRDIARAKITAAGAVKVQLAKGDSRSTLPQACSDIQLASVINIDGGGSAATIASDFAHCLRFSYEGTRIIINNCIPMDYSRGSAFLLNSSEQLKKEYGITLEAVSPIDIINKDPYTNSPINVQCILASCSAQLTPSKLAGLDILLLAGAVAQSEPEIKEVIPEVTFVEPSEALPAINTVEPQEVSAPAPTPFPEEISSPEDCGDHSDVQSVRVCENSCGQPAGKHCELPSDSCGRRESGVEPCHVGQVSEEVVPPVQVPEERQELDQIVEQGGSTGSGEQVSGDSDGKFGSKVSPDVEQGSRRSSRRRRRRSGSDDECAGPQA